jgi:hypothetical protein
VALAVVDRRILIVPDVAAQPSCYIHAERPPQCERAIVVDLASSRQLSAGVIVAFRGADMRRHVCERGWGGRGGAMIACFLPESSRCAK